MPDRRVEGGYVANPGPSVTPRERYVETLRFGKPDRIPLTPGGGRESTRNRWYREGLPREVRDISEHAYRQVGGKLEWPEDGPGFRFNERMIPQFEEKVIEKKGDTQIVQDWKGNICEIGSQYTVEYLRGAIDFVTRRWVKCPVENRRDWEEMKKRYNADDPARFPDHPAETGKALAKRRYPMGTNFPGPFWQLREWMGFEGLCTMLYDDRDLVIEMIAFWEEFISRLLEKCFRYCVLDEVHLSEDMAYKEFSMISPKMTRELLLPTYQRWGEIIRRAGVPIYAMDSDGFIGELIPIWIDAGINVCDPIEVAAGNDLAAFRRRFGRRIAYRGGVDKRAMARGGAVIQAEFSRIEPVVRDGGFIPSCDHGVPADVSWPDFLHYVELLAKVTGWL
jgi:uroporphyrinogen decarboxylase